MGVKSSGGVAKMSKYLLQVVMWGLSTHSFVYYALTLNAGSDACARTSAPTVASTVSESDGTFPLGPGFVRSQFDRQRVVLMYTVPKQLTRPPYGVLIPWGAANFSHVKELASN